MKTLLTTLLVTACLSFQAWSQFEFYIQGDQTNTNYAGSTYNYHAIYVNGNENSLYIDVVNKTGFDSTYVVGRRKLSPVAASWEDGFCWEGSVGTGVCIPPSIMSADYFQMTNNDFTIEVDSAGELKAQFFPETADAGTYNYRYYVGTLANPHMDSIDVAVLLTPASTPELSLNVGVHPNPATDYITVNAEGTSNADVKVLDVLGNTVLETQLSGSTTINVAEYRNGIYFVIVSAEGTRASRKVVVRH